VRRLYIQIPEPTFQALAERALDERRGVREQAGYELERLYPAVARANEVEPTRESVQAK
jgi:hypothetical protein